MVPIGTRARKLSQCSTEVNPPAEQPESIACSERQMLFRLRMEEGKGDKVYALDHTKCMDHTFSAFFIPFANRSSIMATKTLAPLK